MVITITPTGGGGATTIVDGPDRSVDKTMGPTSVGGSLATPAHTRKPIRKAFAKPIQRGGSSGALSFGGVRKCASPVAALSWLLTHLVDCPKGGTITVTEGATSRTFADAALQDIRYRLQGASVHLDYQFIHGEIS